MMHIINKLNKKKNIIILCFLILTIILSAKFMTINTNMLDMFMKDSERISNNLFGDFNTLVQQIKSQKENEEA